jgi:hypothetical protein
LVAYAVPERSETPAQEAIIDEALAWRPLPDAYRGVATRLRGLAGTWAADPQYAHKIAHVANEIRAVA